MLRRLERDDLYILGVVSAWLISFILLTSLLKTTGIALPLVERVGDQKYAPGIALGLTAALVFASIFTGLAVTDPGKGESSFLAGLGLAAANMAWLALLAAHLIASDVFGSMLLLLGVPFYITWFAVQSAGPLRATLFAMPAVMAWLALGDWAGVLVAGLLTLVYAGSITRAESAHVDRHRKALGLLLFVQSVALVAVIVRLLKAASPAEAGAREARNVAVAETMVGAAPFMEKISFGSRATPVLYSAALWVTTFALMGGLGFKTDWGAYSLPALWSLFLLSAVAQKPVSWAFVTWVLALQAGMVAVFACALLVA